MSVAVVSSSQKTLWDDAVSMAMRMVPDLGRHMTRLVRIGNEMIAPLDVCQSVVCPSRKKRLPIETFHIYQLCQNPKTSVKTSPGQ